MDNVSTSVRDAIAREVVTNTLVHREYASAFPAKLIITKESLYTENWNKATTFGRLTPETFTPYPKNPLIAKFFMKIGRADTLGSGVRNLYKFTKIYFGSVPVLEEGDVFKTTIPIVSAVSEINTANSYDTTDDKILLFIKKNGVVSASQIQQELGFKSRTSVQRILTKMLSESKVQKTGIGKNTVYSLTK